MKNHFTWSYRISYWIVRLLIGCCLLLAASCQSEMSPTVSHTATPMKPPTPLPVTTYHVSGAHILDNHGNIFIPYGVQLLGLFALDWQQSQGFKHLDFDEMKSARNIWHSNTVSIQLAYENLFVGASYSQEYLAKVDQEVAWARQEGMNTLLVLQNEGIDANRSPLPTEDSVQFWNFLAVHYRHAPWVFFDIFNEPVRPAGLTEDQTWPLWQHGGDGYVSMQELVDTIRGVGAQNLIFVDGLAAGEDLQGIPTHRLKGDNIIYAIHPYLGNQHESKQDWDTWFGKVAAKAEFPVVADEWNSYQSNTAECIPQAPTLVPQFLEYLDHLHIGLIAWALFPGLLIRGWDYAAPTAFDQPKLTCGAPFPNDDPLAQGAGQLLLRYFAAHVNFG